VEIPLLSVTHVQCDARPTVTSQLTPILRQTASWTGDHFVVTPSAICQPTWLTQPSIPPGRLMSCNPCYSRLRRHTAEGVVRGVAYRRRQRVLLAARLECRLAAGSRPRNEDERRSLALWAVRVSTSHWGLCVVCLVL